MVERVVRIRVAIWPVPTVMAGRMTLAAVSAPPEGNSRRYRAKTMISTRPSQKLGMDRPRMPSTADRLSRILPRCLAAKIPSGMDRIQQTRLAPMVRYRVFPILDMNISNTGRPVE